jgi:putative membrane protein
MKYSDLPALNAFLNGTSAVLLTMAFIFIRRKNIPAHRRCMLAALVCSSLFLTSYLIYHAHVGTTHFTNPRWFRNFFYIPLLISHTLLAAAIVPLIIVTVTRAFRERFDKHRNIARWTWPLWMYVSVTGVMIYFILYWIYPQAKPAPKNEASVVTNNVSDNIHPMAGVQTALSAPVTR